MDPRMAGSPNSPAIQQFNNPAYTVKQGELL
jgi:hypothetical protein